MPQSSSSSPEVASAAASAHNAWADATPEDVLDDLSSRFILNLPTEEHNVERICFQVEQAHWYYEDFIREANPRFPSLPLKKFSEDLFHHCPLLQEWRDTHDTAYDSFVQKKIRVPVCGAIMLNSTWDKCVLVKGWKASAGWGFPKGKINQNEDLADCAVREVLEETGYNCGKLINPDHVLQLLIKEQHIFLYVIPGVPEDFPFETKTRKEISKIEWFSLWDLPTWKRSKASPGKFYLISPFIGPLKSFIQQHKPQATPRRTPRMKKSQAHRTEEPVPPLTYDTTQESSSQSSDPLTPSPHYSEPATHQVEEEKTPQMDPHLARLLGGLQFTTAGDEAASIKRETTPSKVIPASRGPVVTRRTSTASKAELTASSPAASTNQPRVLSPSATDSHSSGQLAQKLVPQSPSHILSASTSSSSVKSPVSPRNMFSRRTSSTADISPYLSRPTPVPTSARTMKHLALLESLTADIGRAPSPITGNRLQAPQNSTYGMPPPNVQPLPYDPNDLRVIYSSHPAVSQTPQFTPAAPVNLPPRPYSVLDDPFQVRPRHGSSFGPLPTNHSHSMGQNQLLALMQGRTGTSMYNPQLSRHPLPGVYEHPIPSQGPISGLPPYPQYNMPMLPQYPPPPSNMGRSPAFHPSMFGHPMHAPAGIQPSNLPMQAARTGPTGNNGGLLSILNNNPTSHS